MGFKTHNGPGRRATPRHPEEPHIRLQRYRAALEGVYAVRVEGLDRDYDGVANIGVRPTVDGKASFNSRCLPDETV